MKRLKILWNFNFIFFQKNRFNVQIIGKIPEPEAQTDSVGQKPTGSNNTQSSAHQNEVSSSSGVLVGSNEHQGLWERGQIEYQGRDAFSNIEAFLDSKLKLKETEETNSTQ